MQALMDSSDREKTQENIDGAKVGQFVLVDRGHCTFVTKTRNAMHVGANLAIVIDNKNEDVHKIVMSDDGTGAGLDMPSMMIGNRHGNILKDYLSTASAEEIKAIRLKAIYEMKHPSNNIVDMKLWYTTADTRSTELMAALEDQLLSLVEHIQFEPRYVTWACRDCDADFKKKACVSDGRYCAMKWTSHNTYETKNIIMEDLR